MPEKDVLTVVIAVCALIFSIASFVLSFKQRATEGRYTLRKTLTDIVAELTSVNIAFNKLDLEHRNSPEEAVLNLRRNYNSQRRYLANHGEFVIEQIPELSTDIDCITIASAFNATGDYVRAQAFFEMAIAKSPSNLLKMWNMRGLASHWFLRGNAQRGRTVLTEALGLELPDTDSVRQGIADTYLFWAKQESEHGYLEEADRAYQLARAACARIGHTRMREHIEKQIPPLPPAVGQISGAQAEN